MISDYLNKGEVVGVNCIKASENLSPFLDGELSQEEEARLLEHLDGCAACSQELDELKRVTSALHLLGQRETAAPSGFSTAVMARINEENSGSRVRFRYLKQAAIGAAAVLLLTAGITSMKPEQSGQVAQVPAQVENTGSQTSNPEQISPVSSSEGSHSQPNSPSSEDPNTPPAEPSNNDPGSPTNYRSSGAVEFAGHKEYIIVSTFLKVNVADSAEAEKQARRLASEYGAPMQSLGQQTVNGKQCLVEKIVVSSSNAQSLTGSLRALGTLVSQDEQKADLTQRFSELYDQYITLKSERAQTQDSAQAAQLDQKIKEAEEQLRAWEQQSSSQTIVLWLQQ